ncbi:TrbI/VirB10 family protein [Sphingobium abikonense]|uniref:TrbI/VirB10 family protein n=1 Tax=Sphingobium abikonense TaxID=86193 RepID=UPI00351177A0
MAPTSPDGFRLGGEPPRVMRLSRKALATLGVAASVAIGGSLIYALQPKSPVPPENLFDTNSRNRAEQVTGAPANYSDVPKLGPPLPGDLGRPIVAAQQGGQNVPIPPIGPPANDTPTSDPRQIAAEQARERAAQERDSARTSQLFLAGGTRANENRADAAPNAIPAIANSAGEAAQAAPASPSTSRRSFLKRRADRGTESPERIMRLGSPNVVQAGSIIPAALITGIRSDLPGQITAQVTQNVYDSPTGRILLIPQGARLIGEYDSDPDHHINGDGDCCVTVWENWLATAADTGIAAYLGGPLREYFLGQFWFEKTGNWPFGERAHGMEGMEEAYADALGIANRRKDILYYLRILRLPRPRGHWPCPCGSTRRLRDCHTADLWSMHHRIPPHLARAMLVRLQPRKGELFKAGF